MAAFDRISIFDFRIRIIHWRWHVAFHEFRLLRDFIEMHL